MLKMLNVLINLTIFKKTKTWKSRQVITTVRSLKKYENTKIEASYSYRIQSTSPDLQSCILGTNIFRPATQTNSRFDIADTRPYCNTVSIIDIRYRLGIIGYWYDIDKWYGIDK